MVKYIVKVIGGPHDGRIFEVENKWVVDRIVGSMEYEGQGYERCDITRVEDDNWFGDEDEWFK